jgi:site-specific DNA-methyltransferase (adenine-specific)
LPAVPDRFGRPALIFADPPYNIGVPYGGHYDDRRPRPDYLAWCARWLAACRDIVAADGSLWLVINWPNVAELSRKAGEVGWHLRQWIVWHETFGTYRQHAFGENHRHILWFVRDRRRFRFDADSVRVPSARLAVYRDRRANPKGKIPENVWTFPRVCGTFRERMPGFPTQLPVELPRRCIRAASRPGDLVVDPFSGSATTGVAALEEGRRYVGIELSGTYAARSRERLRAVPAAEGGAG